MTRYYYSFDAAQKRVTALRHQGIWPGITGPDDQGRYWLTSDPLDPGDES